MIDNWPTRVGIETFKTVDIPFSERFPTFQRDGYIHISANGPIHEEFIAPIHDLIVSGGFDDCIKNMEPELKDVIRSYLAINTVDKAWELCESLMPLCQELLDGDAYIHQSRINMKSQKGSNGWSWHSDFETWHSKDGMPDPKCVTAMIALDDNTKDNGCLRVIPGSHKTFWGAPLGDSSVDPDKEFAEQTVGIPTGYVIDKYIAESEGGIIDLELEQGDVVIFHCNLLHGSNKNKTGDPRRNIYFVYNRQDNRLVKPFDGGDARPDYLGHRNPENVYN